MRDSLSLHWFSEPHFLQDHMEARGSFTHSELLYRRGSFDQWPSISFLQAANTVASYKQTSLLPFRPNRSFCSHSVVFLTWLVAYVTRYRNFSVLTQALHSSILSKNMQGCSGRFPLLIYTTKIIKLTCGRFPLLTYTTKTIKLNQQNYD